MNYIECIFELAPFEPFHEILIAQLSDLPFESFVEEEPVVKAYIQEKDFDLALLDTVDLLKNDLVSIRWTHHVIPKENWNAKWEQSFDPVEVGDFCVVRAPFHASNDKFKHEIIIEPKMSFGTGHHETTQLMIEGMQALDLEGRRIWDMGSGTGILAILAEKMGASEVHAVDIEEWAAENMKENVERNQCELVQTYLGDIDWVLEKGEFDCILANINKNILLKHFDVYMEHLKSGGHILLSGFFPSDISDFEGLMKKHKLMLKNKLSHSDWAMLHLQKA
ncbi:MAG: 50S ribosomal protein L11 methyltransferase [Vicingaceae bacterium]